MTNFTNSAVEEQQVVRKIANNITLAERRLLYEKEKTEAEPRFIVESTKILAEIRRRWDPIFNKPKAATYEQFKERFGAYIPCHRCDIPKLDVPQMREYLRSANMNRAVAACGWRIKEIADLPDALLQVFCDLLCDVEDKSEWPGIILEVLTSMIPKEADPELGEISPEELAVPEATEMRPINNCSPWYSIWSGVRYQQMTAWRDLWLPDSMHGARKDHETADVSVEHSLNMQLAVAKGIPKAAISLDWAKFFDSLERDVGNELMQEMMTDDSEALLVVEAERKFTEQAQTRFKVGRAVSAESQTRANGFLQGPNYSIQIAQMFMAVWTKAIEAETNNKTAGFIDDSSVRSNDVETEEEAAEAVLAAWKLSVEFGKLAGTKLNEKKLKILATSTSLEERLEKAFEEVGCKNLKAKQAIVLVGGVVSNGTRTRLGEQEKKQLGGSRITKFAKIISRVAQLPFGYERKADAIACYATPVLTFGAELWLPSDSRLDGLSGRVHSVINTNQNSWKSKAVAFTLLTKGHQVQPWMALRWAAVRTMRRLLKRRPDLRRTLRELMALEEAGEAYNSAGAGSILSRIATDIGWTIEADLSITRADGSRFHLVEGEDGLFDHILRADLKKVVWKNSLQIERRAEFEGSQVTGVDWEATMKPYREKVKPKKNKDGVRPMLTEQEASGLREQCGHNKMPIAQRSIFRKMIYGSCATGERTRAAKLTKTAICIYC